MRDLFFRTNHAIIFCDTFDEPGCVELMEEELKSFIRMQKDYTYIKPTMDYNEIPFVICRTKSDLNLPFKERHRVLRFAKEINAPLICCSAKENINVDIVFETAARVAFAKHPYFQQKQQNKPKKKGD